MGTAVCGGDAASSCSCPEAQSLPARAPHRMHGIQFGKALVILPGRAQAFGNAGQAWVNPSRGMAQGAGLSGPAAGRGTYY